MKKQYVKPRLNVIVLRNKMQLLQTSGKILHSVDGLFDYEGSDATYNGGAQ